MAKKIFFGMVVCIMLFASLSCENEFNFGENEVATISFCIATPQIATRAYGDGQSANVLQYAVYDAKGNELTDLTVTDGVINGSATVNFTLTTGNTYSVIFWAAAEDAPYTVDFANKKMNVDYTGALCNAENRDAFYKYHTFTVTGSQTETIELKRPFAQLNIGTSDYADTESAGYVPTMSAVTVSSVYSTLDFVNGEVSDEVEAEFAANAIPTNETFPVIGYEYLAMNYLLVRVDKGLVEVEFTYTDGVDSKTHTIGAVPVQRNFRTNLYGALITSDVSINVDVTSEYEGPKGLVSPFSVEGVSFTMVAVEGGTFMMGATSEQGDAAYDDEFPAHQVMVDDFWIGETEVTQELWKAVMNNNPSSFKGDLQRPVECVSWNDCKAFIARLNELTGVTFRLLTEAEWEFAARGGNFSKGYKYCGSNIVGDVAWCGENSSKTTHPVKTKLPNELGLYDMSGNVWEWCADWYSNSYYESSPSDNPVGPFSGTLRVLRGGCFEHNVWTYRVSDRVGYKPDTRPNTCGLRLAL